MIIFENLQPAGTDDWALAADVTSWTHPVHVFYSFVSRIEYYLASIFLIYDLFIISFLVVNKDVVRILLFFLVIIQVQQL